MANLYLNEMHRVFTNRLKINLKKYIKGEIKCHTINDTLVIDVYGVNGIVFRYTRDYIYSEIVHGLTSEMVTQIVVKTYRRYINNLYFN